MSARKKERHKDTPTVRTRVTQTLQFLTRLTICQVISQQVIFNAMSYKEKTFQYKRIR